MFHTLKIILLTAIITFYALSASAGASSLKITHSSTMPPLAFIDENGNPDGILIDLWEEWSTISGINIIFELQNWRDAVSATMDGSADINAGLFYTERRARELSFGDYLFNMKASMFISKDLTEQEGFNQENTICGVLKEGYAKSFMEQNSPYTPLMSFDSAGEMFQAAAEGRIKMFVADYPVAIYQLNRLGIAESFECVKTLYERELRPATGKTREDLIKTVDQFMAAIPKTRKQAIINKWLDPHHDGYLKTRTAILLAAITLLLLMFLHKAELSRFMATIRKRK
ncbi:transporter substrate-binding domain-containing protein [Maridesulfovibrio sp. FT414]|uniref:transporter substrate-binding domain-containing protein n=1 Tax=Maridesulfovibrio sp. FT414 TaxID=2979469 RepID=UPI003D8077FC